MAEDLRSPQRDRVLLPLVADAGCRVQNVAGPMRHDPQPGRTHRMRGGRSEQTMSLSWYRRSSPRRGVRTDHQNTLITGFPAASREGAPVANNVTAG